MKWLISLLALVCGNAVAACNVDLVSLNDSRLFLRANCGPYLIDFTVYENGIPVEPYAITIPFSTSLVSVDYGMDIYISLPLKPGFNVYSVRANSVSDGVIAAGRVAKVYSR